MPRGFIDFEALKSDEVRAVYDKTPPSGLPFNITKIGHVVLVVQDLQRSVDFYTQILGFRVSDVYPDSMMPGGMVFMRCNADHHGVALVGQGKDDAKNKELHHLAFEVATIDEVIRARDHLRKHQVKIDFEGRRRAGAQVAVEFRDPDNHSLEIFWGLDQIGTNGHARPPEEWREELSLKGAVGNAPVGQDTTLADPSLLDDD
jgi:catechol 2,3-dioxygenase-like lactoylglutathione lyase family enzyme